MKHKNSLIIFLVAAAFAVGCKPAEEKSAAEATAAQFDKVQKETKESAQGLKDYSYVQKSEFVEKMHNQIAQINRDLDQLSAKIEKSSDASKAEAKPKL